MVRFPAGLVALALLAGVLPAVGAEPPFQVLAEELVGPGQGVLVRAADGTVLAALHADRPVHPASVMKVATTLALLERLGPHHRFTTRVLAAGPLEDGVLRGDLVVEAEGDPSLVFESAFSILLELRARGVERIEGDLRVRGPLLFNWRPDPAGRRLRRTLAGEDGVEVWPAVAGGAALDRVALGFGGRPLAGSVPSRPLLVHRSPPLVRVMKALNCYSNNVLHLFSRSIGGPEAVERAARESVPPSVRPAIRIDDAAGAGTAARLSPRAAVELLDALARALDRRGLTLLDVLPVAGVDPGTLHARLRDAPARGAVVGKTGTYGSLGASAVAGVVRTRRFGPVTFAVLDRGLAVPEAQRRQDAFLSALMRAADAEPWPYSPRPLVAFAEAMTASGDAP
jgi:D-alanyl-D-alanine carboxypeptidase/D-alanyl-D-alanine-endopeptidase (penicillin-binding protein 4)